jgi:hypothetical protein
MSLCRQILVWIYGVLSVVRKEGHAFRRIISPTSSGSKSSQIKKLVRSRRQTLSETSVPCSVWRLRHAGSFLGWRRRRCVPLTCWNFPNYNMLKPRRAWSLCILLRSSLCSFLQPAVTVFVLGPHILFTIRTLEKQLYTPLWHQLFKFSHNLELMSHVLVLLIHNSLSPNICVKLLQILYETSHHKQGKFIRIFCYKLSLLLSYKCHSTSLRLYIIISISSAATVRIDDM